MPLCFLFVGALFKSDYLALLLVVNLNKMQKNIQETCQSIPVSKLVSIGKCFLFMLLWLVIYQIGIGQNDICLGLLPTNLGSRVQEIAIAMSHFYGVIL